MVLLSLRNLNVRRLKKYYYRFEGTCKKRQGVNVKKVVLLLLTMFNSSAEVIGNIYDNTELLKQTI